VVYVLTTNGDKGWSKDYNMTSERLAGIRYDEQMAAAAVLNVSAVVMLDYEVTPAHAQLPGLG
jgi:LmbE family N-acetylglucosaminyl deacetylase